MKEYVTDAVVLGVYPQGETDRIVNLFTKELGRIDARAIGARKTLSKFSPHLIPGNLVRVRLVKKNTFTLTDVVAISRSVYLTEKVEPEQLSSLFLLRALVPVENPDSKLWHALLKLMERKHGDERTILALLGYDPHHAQCEECRDANVCYFHLFDQRFLCAVCSVKFSENEIHYIPIRI